MHDGKSGRQRAFRPWPENHERLEYVGKIGLNVSEIINEVLHEHLKEHLTRKTKEVRKTLEAPVP